MCKLMMTIQSRRTANIYTSIRGHVGSFSTRSCISDVLLSIFSNVCGIPTAQQTAPLKLLLCTRSSTVHLAPFHAEFRKNRKTQITMQKKIVHHSLTRRKACQDCVASKRRCDLVLPRCGICVKRKLNCQYAKGRKVKEAEAQAEGPLSLSHESSTKVVSPVEAISTAIDLAANSQVHQVSAAERTFNITISLNTTFSIPSRFVPSDLHKSYMTKYLRSNISTLALQNHTFFIHQSSLSLPIPSPLQAALSVSALAVLCSPSTFTILDSNLTTSITTSPQTFYSPFSILHPVQALVVYQLIRLFSSHTNAQQRFHAETSFPLLNEWTIALQTAYFELPATTDTFQEWIVTESIRRTILTSVFLRSYYCSERDGYSELIPLLASLPVTNKGWIWEMDIEEWGQHLGVGIQDQIGTYWEFIIRIGQHKIGASIGIGHFERLLLCLEEDGKVGKATLELIERVKASGCGNIRSWPRDSR